MNPQRRNSYQHYSYQPPGVSSKRRSKLPHRLRRFILSLVLLALIIGGGYAAFIKHKPTARSQAASATQTVRKSKGAKAAPPVVPSPNLTAMAGTINQIISQNSNIDMSVSLIDLNNSQAEHYGDSQAFTAASTTKVITAADFLQEVQTGQQSLNETINDNTAEYELRQMIVISDDDAWDALNDTLGYTQLQNYAASIGASSFQSVPNTVTSSNMALILEKLWDGQLLNKSNTALLLSYLKQANYREYIVPAVPSGDTIYHKIGLYEDNVHDEAIISNGSKAFVIVIFTNGNGVYNWPARAQLMQAITKAALAAYF